jgi:hypothetical protein
MNAMSIDGAAARRRRRTFVCRDDVYDAFAARANELECSVDWLLAEAMKRLLSDGSLVRKPPVSMPPPLPAPLPRVLAPPPPPPRLRRATGSFVGEKGATGPVIEALALRIGDQRVIVDCDRFVIGRSPREANFALRDGGVSRQHAIIERSPLGWVVVDMASTNGVVVNGIRVTRAPLRHGDRLEIGPFAIAVERA